MVSAFISKLKSQWINRFSPLKMASVAGQSHAASDPGYQIAMDEGLPILLTYDNDEARSWLDELMA